MYTLAVYGITRFMFCTCIIIFHIRLTHPNSFHFCIYVMYTSGFPQNDNCSYVLTRRVDEKFFWGGGWRGEVEVWILYISNLKCFPFFSSFRFKCRKINLFSILAIRSPHENPFWTSYSKDKNLDLFPYLQIMYPRAR